MHLKSFGTAPPVLSEPSVAMGFMSKGAGAGSGAGAGGSDGRPRGGSISGPGAGGSTGGSAFSWAQAPVKLMHGRGSVGGSAAEEKSIAWTMGMLSWRSLILSRADVLAASHSACSTRTAGFFVRRPAQPLNSRCVSRPWVEHGRDGSAFLKRDCTVTTYCISCTAPTVAL